MSDDFDRYIPTQPGTPGVDGAWCSHCPGWLPLARAGIHRIAEHQDCPSCQAEVVLFRKMAQGMAMHLTVAYTRTRSDEHD